MNRYIYLFVSIICNISLTNVSFYELRNVTITIYYRYEKVKFESALFVISWNVLWHFSWVHIAFFIPCHVKIYDVAIVEVRYYFK